MNDIEDFPAGVLKGGHRPMTGTRERPSQCVSAWFGDAESFSRDGPHPLNPLVSAAAIPIPALSQEANAGWRIGDERIDAVGRNCRKDGQSIAVNDRCGSVGFEKFMAKEHPRCRSGIAMAVVSWSRRLS